MVEVPVRKQNVIGAFDMSINHGSIGLWAIIGIKVCWSIVARDICLSFAVPDTRQIGVQQNGCLAICNLPARIPQIYHFYSCLGIARVKARCRFRSGSEWSKN